MNTIQLLSDIVLHPRKYDHVVNVPMQFDAAEKLFHDHANDISTKVFQACGQVLIRSGKYIKA